MGPLDRDRRLLQPPSAARRVAAGAARAGPDRAAGGVPPDPRCRHLLDLATHRADAAAGGGRDLGVHAERMVAVLKIGLWVVGSPARHPGFFVGGMAYPSGHTSNIVLVYGLVAYLLGTYRAVRTRTVHVVGGVVVLLSATGGHRSLTLNWHWFADLIAGLLIGGVVLAADPASTTRCRVTRSPPGCGRACGGCRGWCSAGTTWVRRSWCGRVGAWACGLPTVCRPTGGSHDEQLMGSAGSSWEPIGVARNVVVIPTYRGGPSAPTTTLHQPPTPDHPPGGRGRARRSGARARRSRRPGCGAA